MLYGVTAASNDLYQKLLVNMKFNSFFKFSWFEDKALEYW